MQAPAGAAAPYSATTSVAPPGLIASRIPNRGLRDAKSRVACPRLLSNRPFGARIGGTRQKPISYNHIYHVIHIYLDFFAELGSDSQ